MRLARAAAWPTNSSSAAPVPQPPSPMFGWMKMPLDARHLAQALIQLDVGDDAARQHQVRQAGLLARSARRSAWRPPRARAGRRPRRRSSGTALASIRAKYTLLLSTMRKPPGSWSNRASSTSREHRRVAVRRQADDLAFVAARLETERRGHRLVERAERVRVLDAVDALDPPSRPMLMLPARPDRSRRA